MKIRFNQPTYRIFNGRVTECKLQVQVSCTYKMWTMLPYEVIQRYSILCSIDKHENPYMDFEVKALAKCSSEDTFDKETGMRIAESKATLKALHIINIITDEIEKGITKEVITPIREIYDKMYIMGLTESEHYHELLANK